jgi:hypothetical protein
MKNREREIIEMFDNYETTIKEKLVKDITESYGQLLKEIDRRGLARKNTIEYPRLNYFLKSVFFHLFEKLHKEDKSEALKLIAELKTQSSLISPPIDNDRVSHYLKDDISYARAECNAIVNKYEEGLKREVKDLILHTYINVITELNSKNIVQRSGLPQPSLQRFIKVVYSFVYSKLFKGDELKVQVILEEKGEAESQLSNDDQTKV